MNEPEPSIYVRLMPLMHALIGAASVLFLSTLFCGGPFVSRTNCKPCPKPAGRSRPTACAVCPAPPDLTSCTQDDSSAARAPIDGGAAADDVTVATPTSKPAASPSETRLSSAISPCVRKQARSFRLGLRLQVDGKVRRVFVAADPGVDTPMTACIQRQVGALTLPTGTYGAGYLEWRVKRQADGLLSFRLIRPAP